MERLRLVALYALRHEDKPKKIARLKELLTQSNLSPSMVSLVDLLLEYAGEKERDLDVFSEKGGLLKK